MTVKSRHAEFCGALSSIVLAGGVFLLTSCTSATAQPRPKPKDPATKSVSKDEVVAEIQLKILGDGSVVLTDTKGEKLPMHSLEEKPIDVSQIQSMEQLSISRVKGSCWYVAYIGGRYTMVKISGKNCGS